MVSKSLAPQTTPGGPAEITLSQWSQAPASAAMVAFGNVGLKGGNLIANGFLDDAKNTQFPQVFAQTVHRPPPAKDTARQLATSSLTTSSSASVVARPHRRIQNLLLQARRSR